MKMSNDQKTNKLETEKKLVVKKSKGSMESKVEEQTKDIAQGQKEVGIKCLNRKQQHLDNQNDKYGNGNVAAGSIGIGGIDRKSFGNGADEGRLALREAALTKFRLKRKERCFEKKVIYF